MVQSTLNNLKTKTRRTTGLDTVNEDPDNVEFIRMQEYPDGSLRAIFQHKDADEPGSVKFRYGKPGGILWVREKFLFCQKMDENDYYVYDEQGNCVDMFVYFASDPEFRYFDGEEFTENIPWKPSIHMPKKACRLFLKIKSIKVERLQDISEEDAKAEGVQQGIFRAGPNIIKKEFQLETHCKGSAIGNYYDGFKYIWYQINGPGSWNANPWVWVIEFEKIENPNK